MLIPIQGHGWPEPVLVQATQVQGRTHAGQNTLPLQGPLTHTHIFSNWASGDTPIHLMCASLGCGRKLENLQKTYADMGERAKPTDTESHPRIDFVFSGTLL